MNAKTEMLTSIPSESTRLNSAQADLAFTDLLKQHERQILALDFSITGHDRVAADITRETFLRLRELLHTQKVDRSVTAWMRAAAVQAALDYRNDERQAPEEPTSDNKAPSASAQDLDEHDREILATVMSALGRSPKFERLAFILRLWDGLAYEDIARCLGGGPKDAQRAVGTMLVAVSGAIAGVST